MVIIKRLLGRRVKTILRRGVSFTLKLIATQGAGFLAPVVNYMARTGEGTNACLRQNCLPMPVHYYSPVPDLTDLEQRKIWDRRTDLAGINFQGEDQLRLLQQLGQAFSHECNWPLHATGDLCQYYTENSTFGYGCAAGTHSMVRHFKPRRVIEVGSGISSLVIAAALRLNANHSAPASPEYTVIDPYPGPIVEKEKFGITHLLKQRVELLDPGFFEQLETNDILFIDSGHTVRIGGDVNYLILDVLPRLAPGVLVHFHDISLPYEYAKVYATNPSFRVFWTEAYLLQAFLCFNHQFKILLAMNYLMIEQKKAFCDAFTFYDPAKHSAISGGFWIRRQETSL